MCVPWVTFFKIYAYKRSKDSPLQQISKLTILPIELFDVGLLSLALGSDSPCGPAISFFPRGGQNMNIPSAWGKDLQSRAGNNADDQLFTVALTSSNNMPGTIFDGTALLQV
jgi:hypothetical protein